MSCEALIEPNLSLCPQILSQAPDVQLRSRLAQYEVIMALAREYKNDCFMKAFTTLGCFAHSAALFKNLRASPKYSIRQDTKRSSVIMDCYDRFVLAWRDILQDLSLDERDLVFTAEVINANIMFLVECWSFYNPDGQIRACIFSIYLNPDAHILRVFGVSLINHLPYMSGQITDIVSALSKILGQPTDISTLTILTMFVQQLRTISQRISSRPDARWELGETWKKAYSNLRQSKKLALPVAEKSDVCAMIGCETVEQAELRCSRCGNALYCSKTCQRS